MQLTRDVRRPNHVRCQNSRLSYVLEKTGHALAGARQWTPREHIEDPATPLVIGLPLDLEFRAREQPTIDICADYHVGGLRFDFICRDKVLGNCTQLGEFLKARPTCCGSPPAS